MTPEQYLDQERASQEKHEYIDGVAVVMAGARSAHNLAVGDIVTALNNTFRGKCLVYPSDMKVHIPATGEYRYPDVSIVCGKPEFIDEQEDVLVNPLAIFEVLSKSTQKNDRGSKFERYRSIAALHDYVLVHQQQAVVEHFARQEDGTWGPAQMLGAGDRLRLPCGEIAVDDLYLHLLPLKAS